MELSVVIVNYNVRHFLEQALGAVSRAMRGIHGEVWVVDNNSVDDSVPMLREKFPEVKLIANRHNPGFSIANNQAIEKSAGKYVLLLNPDTLVEEDTFRKCLDFMERRPDAGALGCKLIDGSGKYLPESKRGFPSPWVAFCKTTGLSALFPRSKRFNRYYLGHLSEDEIAEVEVLAGCFMFIRREALDKVGLLDEAFFMYGEDIDLSYRIILGGYKNYYFPDTKIIHYKGESTKKGSLNYVKTFYQAMIIFTQKHFQGSNAGLFTAMLHLAIWLRAGLTLARNFGRQIWLPALDTVAIYTGLVVLKNFWANYFYKDPDWFKPNVLWFNFPMYILIWLGTVWLNGGYDRRYDLLRLLRGLSIGTLILAAVYGFLDLDYRPSRALVLMGAVWAVAATAGIRFLAHFVEFKNFRVGLERVKNMLVVGSAEEGKRVREFLQQLELNKRIIGVAAPYDAAAWGGLNLGEIVRIYEVDEIIFCSKDIRAQDIMHWMTTLGPSVSYKIVAEESMSIIGSSSKDEPGELYTIDIRFNINQPGQRRNKRVFDLALWAVLSATFPFWLAFSSNRAVLLRSWWPVLLGKMTWVGYENHPRNVDLPKLPPGVFSPLRQFPAYRGNESVTGRLNFLYAKEWSVWRDVLIFSH